jgi:hypothetical protein
MCLTTLSVHANAGATSDLSYTYTYPVPTLSSQSLGSYQFTKLAMPSAILLGTSGEPALPVSFVQIALPPETTVNTITVTGPAVDVQTDVNLFAQPIKPYQKSIPFGTQAPSEIAYNQDLYQTATSYPATPFNGDYQIGYSHGYTIVSLALQPVQYLPTQGQLRYYPSLTVSINLKDAPANQFFRNTADDEAYVSSLVSNPSIIQNYRKNSFAPTEYPGGLCDPSQHFDYVIITETTNSLNHWDTTESTPNNWDSLISFEASQGHSATVVTLQDIDACQDYQNSTQLFNDKQAHMREFCKDAYQDWGTEYVLIAGDGENNRIPSRDMDSGGEYGVDADIYFSNLDNSFNADQDSSWGEENDAGFDLYSELYVGRVTVDVPQDASNWMTKVFKYGMENDPQILDNAAFYGGDTGWNCQGDDFEDFSGVKTTNNWLGPSPGAEGPWPSWFNTLFGFETWNAMFPGIPYNMSNAWTEEPPNPGWHGGYGQGVSGLRNAINADQVSIISGIAHANEHMSLDVYDTEWQSGYHNTHPFFITDYGCHCGDFDASDDGVLDVMLFTSDTERAFGCVFNTGYGWGQFDDTNSSSAVQQKMFWDYFFDLQNNSGAPANWQIGKGNAFSKDEMAPAINWGDGTYRETIQCMLLFGDPAQMLKPPRSNVPPATPTPPVGPDHGSVAVPITFTTSATDGDNDPISYMFDWGDGTTSAWVGPFPSGATGSADHIYTFGGLFQVKAIARDICYAESGWSTPTTINVGAPIINCTAIKGGLGLKAILCNTGEGNATVHWRITLTSNIITRQSSGIIHALAAGKSLTLKPFGATGVISIGKIQVQLTASATYSNSIDVKKTGFILGPFLFFHG